MFLYFLFIVLLISTYCSLSIDSRKNDRRLSVFFSVIFIIIGTIRWKMGGDWGTYYRYFKYVQSAPRLVVMFEPLFTSFYIIAKYTLNSFVVVQFLQVFFCVWLKYKGFEKYSNYMMFAVFLNFCFYLSDMFTVRNYLAACIAFWSCRYIEEKRPIAFLLAILAAVNVHFASIMMLLAYPLWNLRLSIWIKSAFLISSLIIGLSGIFNFLVSKSPLLINIFSESAAVKLSYYDNIGDVSAEDEVDGIIKILGIIKRIFFIPMFLYFEKYYFNENKKYRAISNLFIFGNCIYFMAIDFRIFQRLSIPFYIFEIPLLLMVYKKFRYKILYFLMIAVYGLSKTIANIETRALQEFVTIFNPHIETYWDWFDQGVW